MSIEMIVPALLFIVFLYLFIEVEAVKNVLGTILTIAVLFGIAYGLVAVFKLMWITLPF